MSDRINHIFKFFEEILPGEYGGQEIRNSQVQMAIDVAGLLNKNESKNCLLVDAPVGTGKTFALLVPALYEHGVMRVGRRIIYATASLNLQSQLRNEELKVLKRLGYIQDFIVAKGQSHYICLERIYDTRLDKDLFKDLSNFAKNAQEGERAEFEKRYYPIKNMIWDRINLDTQSRCKFCDYEWECATYKHREKFNDPRYQMVVTNHNQLIQSVLNVKDGFKPIIDFRQQQGIIIIDEAHDFEDACLSQLAEQLTIKDIFQCFKKSYPGIRQKVKETVKVLVDFSNRTKQALDSSSGRYKLRSKEIAALMEIKGVLEKQLTKKMAFKSQKMFQLDRLEETSKDVLERTYDVVKNALDSKNYSCWFNVEEDKNKDSIVVVSKKFRQEIRNIISHLELTNKLIFTSGTLAVDGSFDHVFYNWGGRLKNAKTSQLPTVFDFPKQAMVYLPKNLPAPPRLTSVGYEQYCSEMGSEIYELIKITGGRTLILCTAKKQVEFLYQFLKSRLDDMGINLLKQGQKSTELLSEDFKNDETSVLIGSGSFFTGLSVKGDALISVVLCKLPFPPKDDPFLELIAEGCDSKDRMELIDIPRMLIKLLQAGGRLIRSIGDYGCFTVLDPRIHGRSYSDKILDLIKKQGYMVVTERKQVGDFIASHIGKKGFASYPPYDRSKIVIADSLKVPEKLPEKRPATIIEPIPKNTTVPKAKTNKPKTIIFPSSQVVFYEKVKMMTVSAGERARVGIPASIKTPYGLFKYLYILAFDKNLQVNILDEFPYDSEAQKEEFAKKIKAVYQNFRMVSYVLTREEIKELEKGWEKKNKRTC
jgi:ATP-dependent DNA helicase DinG